MPQKLTARLAEQADIDAMRERVGGAERRGVAVVPVRLTVIKALLSELDAALRAIRFRG